MSTRTTSVVDMSTMSYSLVILLLPESHCLQGRDSSNESVLATCTTDAS